MVDNKNKDEELWNTTYNDLYDDLRPDYSGLSKEFRESEKLNDDPYWEKTEKRKSFRSGQTHEHKDSDWVMSQHREEAVRIKERETSCPKGKRDKSFHSKYSGYYDSGTK